jgi:ABC-2 type transport system ATP-binding protein
MSNVIETHELTKRYRDFQALSNLSFSVPEGSLYAMLGPNGAGKTTTLDLLVNLQSPTAGEATVLGHDSRSLREGHFQEIGYVSESQEYPGWMTVDYLFAYLKPFYHRWDDGLAKKLISDFSLPSDRSISKLSRGMRMKALLASSMAFRPKLLILDEPFSGLDPLTRDELIEALLENAAETTVLLSSHDLSEIESFVSHVGYLSNGTLGFSEERAGLLGRFREITISIDKPAQPDPWPSNWIRPEVGSSSIRFVETRFESERTAEEIDRRFDGITNIEMAPMSLRNIFLAMARSGQATA